MRYKSPSSIPGPGNGNLPLLQALLRRHASLELKNLWQFTALQSAAWSGKQATAKALIEAGADINTCDANQQSVLYVAALKGQIDVARLLLDHHADIETHTDAPR